MKGDNILVEHTNSRALLTDLGCGTYSEAASLTPEMLPPSTPAYRAPEAWLFARQFLHDRTIHYRAGPADDLYALGVTAYRLVTGEYPELAEPAKDEAGLWHLKGLASPAPIVLNPRVEPQLNALILRMLSMRPEERGTAGELAEALEQAAQLTNPEGARPLVAHERPPLAEATALLPQQPARAVVQVVEDSSRRLRLAGSVRPAAHMQPWRLHLATAAAVLVMGAWGGWVAYEKSLEQPSAIRQEAGSTRAEGAGTAGLGDDAATASPVAASTSSAPGVLSEDTLPEPLPGQAQPDAKGRCPHKRQSPLNGRCWTPLKVVRDECEALRGQMFKDRCYVPVFHPGRKPTAHPVRKP